MQQFKATLNQTVRRYTVVNNSVVRTYGVKYAGIKWRVGGIEDAPFTNLIYVRRNGAWTNLELSQYVVKNGTDRLITLEEINQFRAKQDALGFTPEVAGVAAQLVNALGYLLSDHISDTTKHITTTERSNWNSAYNWGNHAEAGYLKSFTETDPVFMAWDKTTGILISKSQITDFPTSMPASDVYAWAKSVNKPTYNYSEIDGTPTKLSQFLNDLGNYGGFVTGTPWTSAGYLTAITKAQVEAVLTGQISSHTHNYLSSFTETDPVFTAWNKSTGISITKSQISDFPTLLSQFTNNLGNYGNWVVNTDSRLSDARAASDVYLWAKQASKPSYSWTEIGSRPTNLSQFVNDLGNYGSWITASALSSYLLLSGGSIIGDLSVTGGFNNNSYINLTGAPYANKAVIIGNWSGAGIWGFGSESGHILRIDQVTGQVFQGATDIQLKLGTNTVYHSGNLTNSLSTNYLPKWNGSSMVNSVIMDDGNYWGSGLFRVYYNNTNIELQSFNKDLSLNPQGNRVLIPSTYPSTSPTTGTLVVGGGVGVGGIITMNNNYQVQWGSSNAMIYGNGSTYSVSIIGTTYITSPQSESLPATSGTTQVGLMSRLKTVGSNGILDIGYAGGGVSWIQCTNISDLSAKYSLLLNPNGGNLNIGYTTDQGYKLAINGTGYFSGTVYTNQGTLGSAFSATNSAGGYCNIGVTSNATSEGYINFTSLLRLTGADVLCSGNVTAPNFKSTGTYGSFALVTGSGDDASYTNCTADIETWYGLGIKGMAGNPYGDGTRTIVFNGRNGNIQTKGNITANNFTGSAANLYSFPQLNQNTTGNAATATNADKVDNFHLLQITQSAYTALGTKDSSTIYLIVG